MMKKFVMGAVIIILALAITLLATAQLGTKPDLIVKTIRATGAASFAGENITVPVALTIQNIGGADAGPFRVAVMKALEAPAGAESEVEFSAKKAITGLKAKGTLDLTGNVTIAPRSEAGKKVRIRGFVDSQTQVDESNEKNNLSSWIEVQLPVDIRAASPALKPMPVERLPDLTLTEADITITPATPLASSGEDIRVEVAVRNTGMAEARNVAVNFILLDASRRSAAQRVMTIPSIASRNTQRTSTAIGSTLVGMGNYRLIVEIDKNRSIEESNEENNSAEKSLTVLGPELSISAAEIEISPASPRMNETFSFVIPVRNNGNGDALNVEVRWEIANNTGRVVMESSGRGIIMDRIPAHGFNIQRISRVSFGTGMEGDYALRIIVDPRNQFIETDKSNNRAEKLFEVIR